MADDRGELQTPGARHWLPWLELFRGFQVALDLKKLLLAGGGIVVMWLGWWLLAMIFVSFASEPTRPTADDLSAAAEKEYDENDASRNTMLQQQAVQRLQNDYEMDKKRYELLMSAARRANPDNGTTAGILRQMPWDEDRGPNPFVVVSKVVTGQGKPAEAVRYAVLLEPFYKFFTPIYFMLKSNAGALNYIYFLLAFLWTLATWALFGGALTRMAAVQLARREKISMGEALRFTMQRYLSFFAAPLFPLVFVLIIVLMLILFGFLHMIPVVGDVLIDGLGWPLVLLAGLIMAVILVGLVGWPLMYATISTEGSDSFDALSRSYSYVYQAPWQYLWNGVVALAYGCVLVFFVVFMGSFMVYLGKWAVMQTPFLQAADREPTYLFIYAPESFGWRAQLLDDAWVDGRPVVENGVIDQVTYNQYVDDGDLKAWNKIGAGMVAFWLHLLFLMILGFGYSYFWSASTIIYLLMRQKIDDTDLDEVYLEEDDADEVYSASMPEPAETSSPAGGGLQMVDAPKLRTSEKPADETPAESAPAATATASEDEKADAEEKGKSESEPDKPAEESDEKKEDEPS